MSDSASNGGSTVTAIRPGQRLEPSIDHVDPESDPGDAPTVSVLVVDDHTLLADSVMRAVRLEGFEAETVHPSTADAVLEAAASQQPTVTLLDLDLGSPAFSGLDLIAPLTALGTAVVVLTSSQDRLLTAASLEAGAVGILCKSEPFGAVIQAVQLAAAGEMAQDPLELDELRRELRLQRKSHSHLMAPFQQLSQRERDVLDALVDGRSANTIAAMSFVSITTVRSQIRSVLQKLDVNSQLEAVAAATRCGWSADAVLPLVRYSSTLTL